MHNVYQKINVQYYCFDSDNAVDCSNASASAQDAPTTLQRSVLLFNMHTLKVCKQMILIKKSYHTSLKLNTPACT
jgi:hypothetical protein